MDDTKPWWQSKAIWGGIIAFAATVVGAALHMTVPPEAQSALVDGAVAIATGIGSLLAIYGRATATDTITLKK